MVSYVVGNEIACYQLALQPPEVLALKWNMARDAAAWGRHPTNATTSSRYSELLLHISSCQFGNATQQRCAFRFLCGSAATSTKAQKAVQHSVLCIYIEQRHSTNIAVTQARQLTTHVRTLAACLPTKLRLPIH